MTPQCPQGVSFSQLKFKYLSENLTKIKNNLTCWSVAQILQIRNMKKINFCVNSFAISYLLLYVCPFQVTIPDNSGKMFERAGTVNHPFIHILYDVMCIVYTFCTVYCKTEEASQIVPDFTIVYGSSCSYQVFRLMHSLFLCFFYQNPILTWGHQNVDK